MLQPAESSWIEPLVLALYRPAFQLATLLVRDDTVAQDIVQEAFVRVWLSPRTPREISAFRPWLYKTVVNLVRDHHRRRSRWARLRFGRAESADPMDVAERNQWDAALGEAIRALSRREQEVLDSLLENLSNKEIASKLNIAERTVKFHVSNLLSKFGVRRRADLILLTFQRRMAMP